MKIALFIPSFLRGKGGAEKVASHVANLIAAKGGEAWLLCNRREGGAPSYPLAAGVRLHATDLYFDDAQVGRLAPERFDLAIGFGMVGFYSRIVRVADLLGAPFVIQECTNPSRMARLLALAEAQDMGLAAWLRQAVFAHAAAVRFTVPSYAASVVSDIAPFTYGFYNALPVGISTSAPARPGKKIIGVGMMKDDNKNGMAAVRAFSAFSRRHPGWSLHLYGLNKFERQIAEAVRDNPACAIIDHGQVDNAASIYEGAYALVIPSYDEGLPNVVVEAFSNGVPCLGFADCPGVRDLIEHGVTGLLLDRADPDSLALGLLHVADGKRRDELGRNAQGFADRHLLYETWADNWLGMIDNAAQRRDARGAPRIPAAKDPDNPRSAYWQNLVSCYWNIRQLPNPKRDPALARELEAVSDQ